MRDVCADPTRELPATGQVAGDSIAGEVVRGTLFEKTGGVAHHEQFEQLRTMRIELDGLAALGGILQDLIDAVDQILRERLSGRKWFSDLIGTGHGVAGAY